VGASVRARLLNIAREQGEDYQLLLTRYVNERLLYRLIVPPLLPAELDGAVDRPRHPGTPLGSNATSTLRCTLAFSGSSAMRRALDQADMHVTCRPVTMPHSPPYCPLGCWQMLAGRQPQVGF